VLRFVACISCVALLFSCSSPEPQKDQQSADTAAARSFQAELKREEAELARLVYPKCEQVWKDDKLTPCGAQVLKTALEACQSKARETLEGSPVLIDEYTGDSWQWRAGTLAVASIENRVERMTRSGAYLEPFAYALGNGTDEMKKFYCELGEEMHLKHVTDGGSV
jgi:hypothetical protein